MTNGTQTGAALCPLGNGSAPLRLARRLLGELRHHADLSLLVDGGPVRWTDALLAETRFHLAGMMNAMEMAIRLEVADRGLQERLDKLAQPYCSVALERNIELVSTELLDHLRLRAALSVILRGRPAPVSSDNEGDIQSLSFDAPVAQALAALALIEQSWCGPPLLDAMLRPDLPAELFCDLAWVTAALFIRGIAPTGEEANRADTRAIIQAVERVIAGHDEGSGAVALAQRSARALCEEERRVLAPLALAERRMLLFCALTEAETGLATETIWSTMVDGDTMARHAILKLMQIDEALALHVHELLAPLNGGSVDDHAAIIAFVDAYRAFEPAYAGAWLDNMLLPPALAAKLAIIDPPS